MTISKADPLLITVDETDSTNHLMRRMLEQQPDMPDGTTILARRQTAGRGRHGRQWLMTDGALACTILLRPTASTASLASLSLVVAVAVHQALHAQLPQVRIKWPNDILLHDAKLCGILAETQHLDSSSIVVMLGIGLNILPPTDGWPDDLRRPATSIADWLTDAGTAEQWWQRIQPCLLHWYARWQAGGFAAVQAAWMQGFAHGGQQICVQQGEQVYRGIAEGVDASGALLLRHANGLHRIHSGEVASA